MLRKLNNVRNVKKSFKKITTLSFTTPIIWLMMLIHYISTNDGKFNSRGFLILIIFMKKYCPKIKLLSFNLTPD